MDAPTSPDILLFGRFRFDRRGRALFRCADDGQRHTVSIGARALDVLSVLVGQDGNLVSKDELMAAVWPGTIVEEANLAVQISALRRVLDQGSNRNSCIQTVPGRGYQFVLPVTCGEQVAPAKLPVPPVVTFVATTASQHSWPSRRLAAVLGGVATTLLILALAWHVGWLARQPTLPRLSLVVLPFDNLAGDSNDDYLAAGITDGLTGALSHIPGAFVIARTTAYTYRGKSEDIRRIGQDLNVRYVARGSVQRFGQVLRVNAELGSTETGAQLWSDSFDQPIADLAAGQEQIVIRMRAALGITLADIEAARSLRERPANPDAFDLILRARAIEILPQTKETLAETLSLYKQALERDPNAVLALTGAANMVLNVYFFGDTYGGAPHEEAMGRAVHYLERAQKLEPNAESVLVAWSQALDFQEEELDYRRARSEVTAIGRRLIDVYPNNPIGYFRLGVVLRDEGKYDEAAGYFAKAIRLSPRSPAIKTWYWSMAYCAVWAGHDREGLEWIERTMRAEGSLPPIRTKKLNIFRAVAYARTGAQETAKGLVKELKDRYPFETWRRQSPADPESETNRQQALSFMEVLRTAGMREHVDPDEDFGVAPEDVLHLEFEGKTATTAPGVTTVSTERLAEMLEHDKPLVIDSMTLTWHRSIPGAVALDFNEDAGGQNTGGTFADETQKRLERKLRELSDGDMAKPIVAVSWNAVSFAGYNLALRIRHAGYTNVYWYRGGREAWEVAGKPEDVVQPADW